MSEHQAKRQRVGELENFPAAAASRSSAPSLRLHAAVAARDTVAVTDVLRLDRVLYADNSKHVPSLLQQDSLGRTPLHICAALPVKARRRDVYAMLEQLLEECYSPACEGALERQDSEGSTVLHVLVAHHQLTLLHKFLDVCTALECLDMVQSIEDNQGATALTLAQRFGHDAVLDLFEEFNAVVSVFIIEACSNLRPFANWPNNARRAGSRLTRFDHNSVQAAC